jgi:hypothetical protein
MAFNVADLVRTAKTVANDLGLLATVQHAAFSGVDSYGNYLYGADVARKAVVSHGFRTLGPAEFGGQSYSTSVTFLETLSVNVRDRVTLPDGSKPQILRVGGVYTSGGIPVTEVFF